MEKPNKVPETTNLKVPPDLRRQVEKLAAQEDGRTFKGMLLVLIREGIASRK